jgi:hypothetical protein
MHLGVDIAKNYYLSLKEQLKKLRGLAKMGKVDCTVEK